MKRRTFLTAALAIPAVTLAQGTARAPRIGVLSFTATNPEIQAALRRGLKEHGYVEGRNIHIDWRAAEGSVERAEKIAAELVAAKVSVIVTMLTPSALAARKASGAVPIVMAISGDPLGTGLVKSLARPGGNVTGMSSSSAEVSGKRLEILRDVIPRLSRVGLLVNGADPFAKPFTIENQLAAKRSGMELEVVDIRTLDEVDEGLGRLARARVGAAVIQGSLAGPKSQAPELAIKHRIPAMSTQKDLGRRWLLSYGPDLPDLTARSASYVDRILKGANPADLPIEQPTRFELVINRSTARTLGISLPQALLARADLVID